MSLPADRRPSAGVRPAIEMLAALVLGVLVGWLRPAWGSASKILADLFLRAIQMLIAPLVFSTLTVGIAGAGNLRAVGRLGFKSLVYFEGATTLALAIGLFTARLCAPGAGVTLPPGASVVETAQTRARGAELFVRAVPTSVVDAMARDDMLQIVVFAVAFGAGLAMVGAPAAPLVDVLASVSRVMFVLARAVTRTAPIGIFGALAATVASQGLAVLANYARLVGAMYGALILLLLVLARAATWYARMPLRALVTAVREPFVTAFATASSEAALPAALEAACDLGVSARVAGFVVPAGYSFNLDGTALYLTIATLFIAEAAHIELGLGRELWLVAVLTITSKGAAGVPRAAIVVLSTTLGAYGLPATGVMLLLGVDHLLDMGRSAMNVTGNCIAAIVVGRWEGELAHAGARPANVDAVEPAGLVTRAGESER